MGGASPRPHGAFFYASDEAHTAAVVDFVAPALRQNEHSVVITPTRRWQNVASRLGLSADGANSTIHRSITVIDPADVLERSVVDGIVDLARYTAALQAAVGGRFPPQRIYGDAAGLLAAHGNLAGALALEHACTTLSQSDGVQVLCGHNIGVMTHPHRDWQIRSLINAHDHSAIDSDVAAEVVLPTAPRRTAREGELILLWDDYADSRIMYAEALTFSGYRVIAAEDGPEALALGNAYAPDLIVLAVRLPAPIASTMLQTLKRGQPFPAPVLALTAHAFKAERESIANDGFDGVLSKPCLPDALVAAVAAALEHRASEVAAAVTLRQPPPPVE
jgi:CheY-like chemotaxis protein